MNSMGRWAATKSVVLAFLAIIWAAVSGGLIESLLRVGYGQWWELLFAVTGWLLLYALLARALYRL